jgi:hypothetical protein
MVGSGKPQEPELNQLKKEGFQIIGGASSVAVSFCTPLSKRGLDANVACEANRVTSTKEKSMSKKAAEHHRKASEHHAHAARHHEEAAKHHDAGHHEKAAHHAHTARAHAVHARGHAEEATIVHSEEHGKK